MPTHELQDAILRLMGPLWQRTPGAAPEGNLRVDPVLLCFFADQVCPTLSREQLTASVAQSEVRFELALLRSCAAVFLALHIGYAELHLLGDLRRTVFASTLDAAAPLALPPGELHEIARLTQALLPEGEEGDALDADFSREAIAAAAPAGGTAARKLLGRLARVAREFATEGGTA